MIRSSILVVSIALAAVAAEANDGALLTRYAVLVGERSAERDTLPTSDAQGESLLGWDPLRDDAELRRLFDLERVVAVSTGSTRLPSEGGGFSVSTEIDGLEIEYQVKVTPSPEFVMYQVEIYVDGELVSAPRVASELAQHALVMSSSTDEEAQRLAFLVVRADELEP